MSSTGVPSTRSRPSTSTLAPRTARRRQTVTASGLGRAPPAQRQRAEQRQTLVAAGVCVPPLAQLRRDAIEPADDDHVRESIEAVERGRQVGRQLDVAADASPVLAAGVVLAVADDADRGERDRVRRLRHASDFPSCAPAPEGCSAAAPGPRQRALQALFRYTMHVPVRVGPPSSFHCAADPREASLPDADFTSPAVSHPDTDRARGDHQRVRFRASRAG